MKKTIISLTVLATLAVTGYVSSQLRAQNQQPYAGGVQRTVATSAAAPLRTRVAIINLQQVIKQYRKWSDFEESYKKAYAYYNQQFESRKTQGLELKSQMEKTADEAAKEKITSQLKELDRQVQDLGETAKKQLGKMRDEQAVQIYREVEQAVEAYARANDIEMVMHFNDAVTTVDLYHPSNVQRKLQTGACMPMYVAPGMDITNTISAMLNQRLGAAPAPAPGTQR